LFRRFGSLGSGSPAGDARAIPPLVAALDNDDPFNRVMVIYALETLHAREAVPRLLALLDDDAIPL
jgi:HEAT repeat protein